MRAHLLTHTHTHTHMHTCTHARTHWPCAFAFCFVCLGHSIMAFFEVPASINTDELYEATSASLMQAQQQMRSGLEHAINTRTVCATAFRFAFLLVHTHTHTHTHTHARTHALTHFISPLFPFSIRASPAPKQNVDVQVDVRAPVLTISAPSTRANRQVGPGTPPLFPSTTTTTTTTCSFPSPPSSLPRLPRLKFGHRTPGAFRMSAEPQLT